VTSREAYVFFPPNVVFAFREVNVFPRRERHLFVSASCAEEEFIANARFIVHAANNFRFLRPNTHSGFLFDSRHFIGGRRAVTPFF